VSAYIPPTVALGAEDCVVNITIPSLSILNNSLDPENRVNVLLSEISILNEPVIARSFVVE
jgi:hypothetical protein